MTDNDMSQDDLDQMFSKVMELDILSINEIKNICDKAKEIFMKEPTILEISAPITLVGDIHGQFQDLLEIFYQQGYPKDGISFIFIGDYVDRGLNSVEVLLILLILKIQYPQQIYMTRGNHESQIITQQYGFYDEILRKFGSAVVWQYFTEVFNTLPLGAIINNKIYCLHGGLSPSCGNIDDIKKKTYRFMDVPRNGLFCDMLWSDPEDRNGWGISQRGAGFTWGYDCSEEFLHVNGLKFISRAHQLVMKGYNWCHNNNVLSIFSAPNYCYRCGNEAAILEIEDENNYKFVNFSAAPKDVYNQEENDNGEGGNDQVKEKLKKINQEYFHIKYEMRYFI